MKWGSPSLGVLELELTSAQMEAALEAISKEGISLMHLLRMDELSCHFQISAKEYAILKNVVKKRGDSVKVIKRQGFFWKLGGLLNRPVLLAGIFLLLALVLYLPSRIFFVRVEGNRDTSQKEILAAAEACGIGFGSSRREVRSEKMKNALLAALPQLQWAGVNTSGCVAVISVREGPETKAPETKGIVTSIAAIRDGHIISGTVTRGQGMFYVGQTVREGQILISGYTDCGLCIRAEKAEGEILAQTVREIEVITPSEVAFREEVLETKRMYSLIFRKKRINLWKDSGISPDSCGRMYKEYYIALPGGFRLPFALCIEEFVYCNMEVRKTALERTQNKLSDFAEQFLSQQMVAGSIKKKDERVSSENGIYRLTGKYVCTEMIGREVPEQIGETNGKSG